MLQKLIRHGSNAGYRAELAAGNDPCDRCHKAHLVYQTQYSKVNKARGIKYTGDQVIDHLYGSKAKPKPAKATYSARTDTERASDDDTRMAEQSQPEPSLSRTGPSLSERIRSLVVPSGDDDSGNEYVETDEPPDYLHSIDPDPEPSGEEWSTVADEEFVLNAAGMRKIEENLGTYLSIVGMTAEMVDPYCGRVLSDNFENIVKKWTKVISHYPKAAALFLDGKGGTVFAWIAAMQATWPVLFAFYEHHLSRTVQTSGGTVYRKMPAGVRPDATTPPMPQQDNFDYSAA